MTRELNKFQIQLADTFGATDIHLMCVRCKTEIDMREDPEHIVLFPATNTDAWRMHIDCYGEIMTAMDAFFRVFIVEKRKRRIIS